MLVATSPNGFYNFLTVCDLQSEISTLGELGLEWLLEGG